MAILTVREELIFKKLELSADRVGHGGEWIQSLVAGVAYEVLEVGGGMVILVLTFGKYLRSLRHVP